MCFVAKGAAGMCFEWQERACQACFLGKEVWQALSTSALNMAEIQLWRLYFGVENGTGLLYTKVA